MPQMNKNHAILGNGGTKGLLTQFIEGLLARLTLAEAASVGHFLLLDFDQHSADSHLCVSSTVWTGQQTLVSRR